MSDLIDRQAAIDALKDAINDSVVLTTQGDMYSHDDNYFGLWVALSIIQKLPSAQPESTADAEFWRKRADYYSDMCSKLIADMGAGVKIEAVKIDETGITFTKKKPSAQLEPCEDAVSREAIMKHYNSGEFLHVNHVSRNNLLDFIEQLPSVTPKAEQPEIIHCRDCMNWDKTWTNDFSPNHHYCPMVDGVRKDNFYCADAVLWHNRGEEKRMADQMLFPDTVEEFMEQYKIVDTEGIYMSKGSELVPIFRMKQWFEHEPEVIHCRDCKHYNAGFECLIEGYGIERDKDWYCADAERRTYEL